MVLDMFSPDSQKSQAQLSLDEKLEKQRIKGIADGELEVSLMDRMFGTKERAGIVPVGINAASGIVSSWLGYQNYRMAKQNNALQREAFEHNKSMSNMEASLKLDAMKRGLNKHGISSDVVNKYSAKFQ